MLKIVSVCAALVLAAATFSTSAVARPGGNFGGVKSFGGGPGKMSFGGPGKMMSYGGPGPGRMNYGPGKLNYSGPGKMVYSGPPKYGQYGQWQGKGGTQYGYYDRRHHRHYGGYWPWAAGAGLALAATWPYYGGYGLR